MLVYAIAQETSSRVITMLSPCRILFPIGIRLAFGGMFRSQKIISLPVFYHLLVHP